jgi:hypothetical protein
LIIEIISLIVLGIFFLLSKVPEKSVSKKCLKKVYKPKYPKYLFLLKISKSVFLPGGRDRGSLINQYNCIDASGIMLE